ncbi:MAG: hypothetical protein GF353_16155 [Candidatus Lokiarchaeota archaeon]|nr:hypothetical protein [Candidatus Lokiarchaeota archaeon]
MRSRKPFLLFWPQYFEAKKTRKEGRRLPKNLAIDKVTTGEIAEAAKKLGYLVEVEYGLRYPRTWWEKTGRVSINTKGKKKSKIIHEIAREIRRKRG